ncbi:MAG: hypothetical protein IJ730_02550 [Alphaproteobacteria bacterium]|nr:hypothetical protein [Alphaproteobacteria bacterium]
MENKTTDRQNLSIHTLIEYFKQMNIQQIFAKNECALSKYIQINNVLREYEEFHIIVDFIEAFKNGELYDFTIKMIIKNILYC